MILFSQVLNGILLPVILVFILLLVNREDLLGEWTNSKTYNAAAYLTVAVMTILSLALVWQTLGFF